MKIYTLNIKNNRKVRAFKKDLNGDNLHVAGDTGTGKTTVINTLWELMDKSPDTITHGADKSEIRVKLSDGNQTIIAKRITTEKSSQIVITDQDGENIGAKEFQSMISTLAVNPHKIKDLKPTEQIKKLLESAHVEIDLDDIDAKVEQEEKFRYACTQKMDAINPGKEPDKVEMVSLGDLLGKRSEGQKQNDRYKEAKSMLEETRRKLQTLESEKAELERKLKEKTEELEKTKAGLGAAEKTFGDLREVDLTEIDKQISAIEQTNQKANAWAVWNDKNKEYEKVKIQREKHDAEVKRLREVKKNALDNAKWPISRIEVKEGKIYYNGSLLENLGESEQILVCSALALKDIEEHPIHVVRLDGVESMSKADFDTLVTMFNGHDIQVLSTRVSRGEVEPNEIVIEDGDPGEDDEE